jgi:hypothetical protein
MATAASYDSTLRYGTQTPFNDQLTFHWEGGEWRVDATHNSIITAGNGGSAAAKTLFTIYYDGGKKRYDLEQKLKPHEQMWVDVGKLIHDQVPDKNGLVLPADLMMGSYELQDLTDRGVGNLYEGKVIVDKTFGHVAYGCATCCGYFASPWMYYDPIDVGLSATSTQGVWDHDNCTSQDVSVGDYFGDWNTGNHAIATASKAVITGVAVGSTKNSATGTLTIGNINSLRCPQEPTNPSGPANVASLSCTSSVARGGTATCTASGPAGSTFSNWKFADNSGNPPVNGSGTSNKWSGAMVTSGTVSVTVATGDGNSPQTAQITVSNRTGFGFTAVNPAQVSAISLTCYDGTTEVLPSPPSAGSAEGFSCADLAYSFNFATVSDGGPNNGYEYVTSVSASSGSSATQFQYIVVSDLLSASPFYNAQCGTFSSSNSSGFIAGSQLKQDVFDHESGSVLSHWTEYVSAQNNSANNIGTVLESTTAPPGSTGNSFATSAGNAALNRIAQAVTVEPCGGVVTKDSSQSCALCGNINFSPYTSCSGSPVPYCN